jgi:hypothetical protein
MFEAESLQRFIEGLKLSISCSREMQRHEPKAGWKGVTEGLQALLVSGTKLAHTKALTRQALLADADRIQRMLGRDSQT